MQEKMMRNYIFAAALLVATGVLWPAASARAAVYTYVFQSLPGQPAETMNGTMTVVNGEVTSMTGALSGTINDTVSQVYPNTDFPAASYSPDGRWIYDNQYNNGITPLLTNPGVLFTTYGNSTGYWNLYSITPNEYTLGESVSGGFSFFTSGQFTDPPSAPGPLPGAGLAGLSALVLTGLFVRARAARG
jgi:hypothetical protein